MPEGLKPNRGNEASSEVQRIENIRQEVYRLIGDFFVGNTELPLRVHEAEVLAKMTPYYHAAKQKNPNQPVQFEFNISISLTTKSP